MMLLEWIAIVACMNRLHHYQYSGILKYRDGKRQVEATTCETVCVDDVISFLSFSYIDAIRKLACYVLTPSISSLFSCTKISSSQPYQHD